MSHRFQHPRPAQVKNDDNDGDRGRVLQIELNHNFQGASKMENEWTFLIRNLKPTTPYEVIIMIMIIMM